jgi:hypothetical protein
MKGWKMRSTMAKRQLMACHAQGVSWKRGKGLLPHKAVEFAEIKTSIGDKSTKTEWQNTRRGKTAYETDLFGASLADQLRIQQRISGENRSHRWLICEHSDTR